MKWLAIAVVEEEVVTDVVEDVEDVVGLQAPTPHLWEEAVAGNSTLCLANPDDLDDSTGPKRPTRLTQYF